MKRSISILVFLGLAQSAIILPYAAEKKGVRLVAVDYARTPDALCIEAPVTEFVQGMVGKGIPAQGFLNVGLRPVGITITNTGNKPMMLSPFYGMQVLSGDALINRVASSVAPPDFMAWICAALIATDCFLVSTIIFFNSDRRAVSERRVALSLSTFFLAALAGSTFMAVRNGSAVVEFQAAMAQKFEKLNFKDEVLILPGQTVYKLLLCQKDAYISRFPLVIYPLENREEMIVFDVDLRA